MLKTNSSKLKTHEFSCISHNGETWDKQAGIQRLKISLFGKMMRGLTVFFKAHHPIVFSARVVEHLFKRDKLDAKEFPLLLTCEK